MPVFLKELKKELQSDRSKVGKDANGDFKFTPPSIIGRLVSRYPKLRVSKLTKKGVQNLKWLTYTGLVSSENTGIRYRVSIQFNDMEFRDVPTKLFKDGVLIKKRGIARKQPMFHKVPTAVKNQVRIQCSCLDFAHRFSNQLAIFDALVGQPNNYTRKTPAWPVGRPMVNSTDKIGYCKHVSSLLNHLNDKGLIKER